MSNAPLRGPVAYRDTNVPLCFYVVIVLQTCNAQCKSNNNNIYKSNYSNDAVPQLVAYKNQIFMAFVFLGVIAHEEKL